MRRTAAPNAHGSAAEGEGTPVSFPVAELARRIFAGGEWALLDVQEPGPFVNGHIFHACPAPYSRLELRVPELVPRKSTPVVLTDHDGGDVAKRAARRLASLGYVDVQVLEGGNAAWAQAGHTLFQGMHVPSKAFGELVEHRYGTPSVSAEELVAWRAGGRRVLLLDGRPFDEYHAFTIPGSVCCPNGELALRAETLAMASDADELVVNCAGRTRSILGAETLRRLLPGRRVHALRNGTQGWFLAGLEVERGAARRYPDEIGADRVESARHRADDLARLHGVPRVAYAQAREWIQDPNRTTYLFDVRSAAEHRDGTLPGARHAPGGQLLQATEQWMAVAGARVVVFDAEGVRAPTVAVWLREMGIDAFVLHPAPERFAAGPANPSVHPALLPSIGSDLLAGWRVVDLRDSGAYRLGHPPGARWSTRARLERVIREGEQVAFVADEPSVAALAAVDAAELGAHRVAWLADPILSEWTPGDPPDAERIDHVFFTAGRHTGSRAAAEQYLAWEVNLVRQLGPLEWTRFPTAFRGQAG